MINKYDKLVKLLNEYREKEHGYNVPEWEEKELSLPDYYIISKELGFIKRLVVNDKIKFNIVERVGSGDFIYDMTGNPYYNSCFCEDLEEYGDVDRVLMLLAIQDEPIEFLISILK